MAHLDPFRSKATLSQTLLGLKCNRNPIPYPNPSYLLTLPKPISTVFTFPPLTSTLFCLLLYSQPWYNVHCSCYKQEIPMECSEYQKHVELASVMAESILRINHTHMDPQQRPRGMGGVTIHKGQRLSRRTLD